MSAKLFILLVASYLLIIILPSPVHAVGINPGDQCPYNEDRDDGIYTCQGIYELNNPDDPESGLVCKYDASGRITPACVKQQSSPSPSPSSPTFTTKVDTVRGPEPPNSANWDPFKQMAFSGLGLVNMVSCFGNAIPFGTDGCPQVTVNPATGKQVTMIFHNGEGGGALGAGTHFIAQIYENPPASGIQYMASAVRGGLNLGKPAYADVGGSGAGVIEPVQKIWKVFRDIAYLGFVIIFVVAGFMIMFRAKLNPQTVVSIQTALPGLVIGLVLVTFSYFISGLIIDLAFVGSHVVGILFLSQIGGDSVPSAIGHVQNLLNTQNAVQMFSNFIFTGNLLGAAENIGNGVFTAIVQNPTNRVIVSLLGALGSCIGFTPYIGAAFTVAPPAGFAALAACAGGGGAAAGIAGGVVISGIIYIVLLFGLLQAVFRLLFSLIGAYVSIIFATIFSPFIILWSSVPGQGAALGLWWKGLLANVLIFPAVFAVFLLVASILGRDDWWLNSGVVQPFNQTLPLLGGGPVGFIQAILAYGLLLAVPGIPDFVRETLGARPNQILQQSVSRGFATGGGAGQVGVLGVVPAVRRVIQRFR